jgi:L-fucose isomerase-like protein
MPRAIRLALTAVASPLEVGAQDAPALLARLQEGFAAAAYAGLELCVSDGPLGTPEQAVAAGRRFYDLRVDVLCVVAASWFEDYLVLDLLEECRVPVVLWARRGMETGALCGMQQLSFMLRQLGIPSCFLFGEPGDETSVDRAWQFAQAAALQSYLRRARIGHLGHRVEGMTETTAHELALKKIFGPRVVGIDSHVFLERVARADRAQATMAWHALKGRAGRVTATEEAGVEALQVYAALHDVIDELGLAAVAVGCYPHLMGKVCLSGSLLGEQGISMACEGDVNGALGMIMLTRLTDEGVAPHNTDLLDPIPAENSIVYSHCGSGCFALAANQESIALGPVRLMDRGVCSLFPARPGPVTLVNIVASMSGYRMAALYGEAVETDMIFPGNPLRVRFAPDYRDILAWIAREGLGHHWMAGYGDVRVPLADLSQMVGCEWLSMA